MLFNIDNSLSPFLYPIRKKDIKILIFPSVYCYNKENQKREDKQKL